MADKSELLDAQGMYVSLGGLPILRDVSLHVHAGEAVAILGGNGSGKSTTIRAVLGLTPFQEGSVRLFGTELSQFHAWDRVGYVPAALQPECLECDSAGNRVLRPTLPPRDLPVPEPFGPHPRDTCPGARRAH